MAIDMSPEALTIFMLASVVVGLAIGYPLGFVLGTIGLVSGYIVYGNAVVDLFYSRVMASLLNYVKLAVPLFVFMGTMLGHSGIAEKMYDAFYLWFGRVRGGLAVITILIATILAATVGIIAASITMLSLVALPAMVKRGYSKSLATAAICAGGCLGILIPPSVMLVVYGPMAGLSVGKLFFGAFIPGFVLSGLYCAYILLYAFFIPKSAPAVPLEEIRKVSFARKTLKLIMAVAPAGLLILSVLGVIFFGIAPPTEAAAIGAFAATLLVIANRRFSLAILKEAAIDTVRVCGFIFLIIGTATAFSSAFIGGGGSEIVERLVLSTPGGRWGALTVMLGIVFVLGFVMDWIGIALIVVPIITPVGNTLGFDPIWFAIMVCVMFQTGYMTPPFAMGIFITRGAAPPECGITTTHIIRGVIPFVLIILIAVILFTIFPQLITWLPGQMIK